MTGTELGALKSQVNVKLLDDIISFVVKTANTTPQQRNELWHHCIFPNQNAGTNPFQTEYGFLYLGELLERFEERFGMTEPDRRAIALALGYTRDIVTEEMFVGSQQADFIQSVKNHAQDDIYLIGALYLLSKGEIDGEAYEKQLTERQYSHTEELIFAMSLLDDIEQVLPVFKPQLSKLLGEKRTIPVYGNSTIFGWLVYMLHPFKKQLAGKPMALLRALLALPASFVKEGSKQHDCLLEHGYTPLEIAYANMMAVHGQWIEGGLKRYSLMAEKIAVSLFRTLLIQETSPLAEIYDQLTELYSRYSKFEVKYCGTNRLSDTLKPDIRIKDPNIMVWFIARESVFHPANDGFDVMDPKWDPLVANLHPPIYRQLFEESLSDEMDSSELRQRIERYDTLTHSSYLDCYWKSGEGSQFPLLVRTGVIDLWSAFQASLSPDGAVVSPHMLSYIGHYIKSIGTIQAVQFLKQFMPQYGHAGLVHFFSGCEDGFERQLWKRESYRSDNITLTLQRDFLADDPAGQLLLLHWVEEYFFSVKPAHYLAFIWAVLEDSYAASLLPIEDLRRLFKLFLTQSTLSTYAVCRLKQRYFTPEEQLADQKAQDEKEQELARKRHNKKIQDIRENYAQTTDTTFQSVYKFIDHYRFHNEESNIAAHIVQEEMGSRLEQTDNVLEKKDVPYFLCVCAKLLEYDAMAWAELQTCILNLKEVASHDPCCDSTV